ncbi:hypothetical protein C8N35_101978 [Breoghania corrubedonensis]|uniref:Uncharacterized protein n=1 Tax=Breoghania corrubedonensis TaxID=665038 RepID=A0A2T5VGQ3_9HYPH|nr:hypothetical protein [Breoghania corrubedonensis]PTW62929.1 hypothetical protein C8N35_101978 [Breoghania corrubedonensis]
MERISTHIGVVVISFALALTVTVTASRLTGDFASDARAEPVLSIDQSRVVTNTAKKGDRIALDESSRLVNGAPKSDCVSRGTTTICKAVTPSDRVAQLD